MIPVFPKDPRAPALVAAPEGPAAQFQSAAVLLRRAALKLEMLSVHPDEERARAANEILIEAGGLFSDACFDLGIRL